MVSEKNVHLLISTFNKILEQLEVLTDQKMTNVPRFYLDKEGKKAVNVPHILDIS